MPKKNKEKKRKESVKSGIIINFSDLSGLIKKATDERIDLALEAVGQEMETNAKKNCPVDTGLLRNSIAHAVAGQVPSLGGMEKKAKTYEADKPNKNGVVQKGTYTRATEKKEGEKAVYIGSNVEYAPAVEFFNGKKHNTGKAHFLRDALAQNHEDYKRIIEDILKA